MTRLKCENLSGPIEYYVWMKSCAASLLFVLLNPCRRKRRARQFQREHSWNVDGSCLYNEECGAGPKAIILLHVGVMNSAVWDDVWPTFCKQFHVIRSGRRGYGRSPATKKPYFEADDVAAVLHDRSGASRCRLTRSSGQSERRVRP